MKKRCTKKIAIIIILISFFTILFSKNVFGADIYTIEDIIFNEVPVLDINFFSDTAGGQAVVSGSIVHTLRQVIVTWYVSIRNLVIMGLGISIVYTGIRMAISTIPSGKAKYQKMLVGWVKALVIVLTMHYMMLLIIRFNDMLVDSMKQAELNIAQRQGWQEDTIYDTIRTRAYDFRASIGLTGMIMYLTLVIIWIRFLWVYIKRLFTILILVIIAPFIGAKYAIDSSSGKKGNSFTSWLYDFTMNVLLQAVHALVYVALIASALELSLKSIMGFVIALVFFNFMLKSDEIFRNIFSFDRSKLSEETAKQQGYKEIIKDFAGVAFIGQMATGAYGMATGGAKIATKPIKWVYKGMKSQTKEKIEEHLNNIDRKLEETFKTEDEDTGVISDLKRMVANDAKIRRLSRKKGSMGIKARQLKAKLKSQRKKRYQSNYKFVKDTIVGAGSIILAIPMTVVNPGAGVALFTKGKSSLKKLPSKDNFDVKKGGPIRFYRKFKGYKVYYGNKKAKEKYEKKRNSIYTSIKNINDIDEREEKIREKYKKLKEENNIQDNEVETFKNMTKTIMFQANSEKIDLIIEDYVKANGIKNIDNSTIDDIIDVVVNKIGSNMELSGSQTQEIANRAKKIIIGNNRKKPDFKYKKPKIATGVSDSLVDKKVDSRFADIAKDIIALENKINEAEKKAKTNYRHANKFLDSL